MPQGVTDGSSSGTQAGHPTPAAELRDVVLTSLSSIQLDDVEGSLTDTGIIDQVDVEDGRVEVSLRAIGAASPKAGDATYRTWEQVQQALEQTPTSDTRVSIEILWSDPWTP